MKGVAAGVAAGMVCILALEMVQAYVGHRLADALAGAIIGFALTRLWFGEPERGK